MTVVVYDAGALIAAERADRAFWADHRVRLERAIVPLVPAVVLAQVSRSVRQVQLHRVLQGCEVVPLDADTAHRCGRLLGAAGSADVADASVVVAAGDRVAEIVTGDRGDIERLVGVAGIRGTCVVDV
ncbi:MAG: PIN domain-containing protein [Pseudonocardia sp.]